MSTFTASLQFSDNVKSVHTGVLHTGSQAVVGVTLTAASIVILCDVPHGATLLDWSAFVDDAGANQTCEFGTSNTPCGIAAAFSLSSVAAAAVGASGFRAPHGNKLPARISLSDDAQPLSVPIQAKMGAAVSASMVLTFNLFYTMDGTNAIATIR